jgi:hypothetical protein
MTIISDYGTLQANHPTFHNIMSLIDGEVKTTAIAEKYNTCCIQLSMALNKSQLRVENYDYFDPWLPVNKVDSAKSNRVRALSDTKGDNYIFSVLDMKVYLNNKYFKAENYQKPYKKNIAGRKGIIAFGIEHIDLWNGKEFHQEQIFGAWSAWDHSDAGGGIFFWEVMSPATILEDGLK